MINQLGGQTERNVLHVGVPNPGTPDTVSAVVPKPVRSSNGDFTKTVPQDSVELSNEARQLSQSLRDQKRVTATHDKELQKTANVQQEKATYFEVVKYFPPFLGNTKRLEVLENYPQLLKEIEKMMVPPPLDMSVTTANSSGTTSTDAVKANE